MSNNYKACPFLAEMLTAEIGESPQHCGWKCTARCFDCPANEKILKAEVGRLKADFDARNSALKIAYADIRKLGDENERLKRELEIQKNLTRQQCFLTEEAYKETDKWKKMFYDLADKQASVSTDPRFVIVGKDSNVPANDPDNNVGTMGSEEER